MAAERVPMRKLREIVRLKLKEGLSGRAIARSCGLSPATASEYLGRIAVAKLTWPLAPALDDDEALSKPPADPSTQAPRTGADSDVGGGACQRGVEDRAVRRRGTLGADLTAR